MVGFKRLGIGAARNRVQHGRFNFQKVVGHHEFPQGADSPAARHEALANRFVGDQVDITLAVFDFLVSHAVEFVGQRPQAFGDQANVRGVNRQFACLGFKQRACGRHDIAQVPVLERAMHIFANALVVDINLNTPA